MGEEAGGEAVPVPEHGVRDGDAEDGGDEYGVGRGAVRGVGHGEGGADGEGDEADGEGLAGQGLEGVELEAEGGGGVASSAR